MRLVELSTRALASIEDTYEEYDWGGIRISLLRKSASPSSHVWRIVRSSGILLQIWGMLKLFGMALLTSVIESYAIVWAVSAVVFWEDKGSRK